MKIFISSVQKEFATERKALAEYLAGDPLLRRFFEYFRFEDQPAADQRADQCYLDEVDRCDIYLGIFGNEYGREDAEGLSPTHREFNRATEKGKTRLIFVKGAKDRLEVWNPGTLPPTLTLEKLRGPHASVPHNPLLAEPMYLTKYIERMGTGIRDMIRRCQKAGLPELEIRIDGGFFVLTIRRKKPEAGTKLAPVAAPVTAPVAAPVGEYVTRLLVLLADRDALSNADILVAFGLKSRRRLRDTYIDPALADGLVERTIPEKPTSRLQKYRLTEKGRRLLEQLEKERGRP